MALLNINQSVDAFYRYKMERVQTKLEGNFTVIVNFGKICLSLDRNPKHVLKYLGQRIGTAVAIKHDKYTLTGNVCTDLIQKYLYDFINLYVLCSNCENPETKPSVVKNRLVQKCVACGFVYKLKSDKTVDMMIKDLSKKDTGKKKRVVKTVKEPTENMADTDDDWLDDTSAEAVKARREQVFGSG